MHSNVTYSEIDTAEFSSLLSFKGKSINGHQANDEEEGVDEHFAMSLKYEKNV